MGPSSASVSSTTNGWPARRPTARTSVGSTPGSASRRSSAASGTASRSSTSSTVNPNTRPPPTWSSIVVPPASDSCGAAWCNARHPSTTVTIWPRTLTSPATTGGAPGIRVTASRGRISRTLSTSAAQARLPTRKTSSRTAAASLIGLEETKILHGVTFSKQSGISGGGGGGGGEMGGPLRTQGEVHAGNRMRQRQCRRMEQLARCERFEPLRLRAARGRHAAAAAVGVFAIAHHGMPDVREVHPDLVRAAGAERHAHELGQFPARYDRGEGDRVPPARLHRHALALVLIARDGRGDLHRALGEVAPDQRGIRALHTTLLDRSGETAVHLVRLGQQHQPGRITVEAVHDPRPARHCAGGQVDAASDEDVDETVLPMAGPGMHDETRGLVEHREVLVFEHEAQLGVRRRVGAGHGVGRELDGDFGAALEQGGRAQRAVGGRHELLGDETGGLCARQRELVGEKAVEALGGRGRDAEPDGEGRGGAHGAAAVPASFTESWGLPSSPRIPNRAQAPAVRPEAAPMKSAPRQSPTPTLTKMKSTTPCALRTRSTMLPAAPAHSSPSTPSRTRSPGRVWRTMEPRTKSATIARTRKIQREYSPRQMPKAAHLL